MDREAIHQVHVLLEGVMHKSDAVSALLVIDIDGVALILEPLNLVSSDAVHAASAHAIAPASTEEPETSIILILLDVVLNWHLIGKLMNHWVTIVLVEVWHLCSILALTLQLLHLMRVEVPLEVVIAWHHSPWHFKIFQRLGQLVVVSLPELSLCAIPALSADDIARDGNKVRFFF